MLQFRSNPLTVNSTMYETMCLNSFYSMRQVAWCQRTTAFPLPSRGTTSVLLVAVQVPRAADVWAALCRELLPRELGPMASIEQVGGRGDKEQGHRAGLTVRALVQRAGWGRTLLCGCRCRGQGAWGRTWKLFHLELFHPELSIVPASTGAGPAACTV